MTAVIRLVRVGAWCGLLACAAAVVVAAGAVAPLPGSPGELGQWLADTPPELMAAALLRVVGLGLTGYLAAVTLIAVVVRCAGADPRPVVRRLAGRHAARVVAAVLGAAVVATPATSLARSGTAGSASPPPATLTLVAAEPVAPPPEPSTLTLDPAAPSAPPDGPPTAPETGTAPVSDPPPAPTIHVVRPGEHFWSIARAQVAARTGDPRPSDRAIWPYWRALIEANRDRLVVPDDPDLLYPGQELVLP